MGCINSAATEKHVCFLDGESHSSCLTLWVAWSYPKADCVHDAKCRSGEEKHFRYRVPKYTLSDAEKRRIGELVRKIQQGSLSVSEGRGPGFSKPPPELPLSSDCPQCALPTGGIMETAASFDVRFRAVIPPDEWAVQSRRQNIWFLVSNRMARNDSELNWNAETAIHARLVEFET